MGSFNLLQSLTVLLEEHFLCFFFVHACLAKFSFKAVRIVSVLHTALQCSGSCIHSKSRRLPHNGIISGLFIYFSQRCSTHRKLRRKLKLKKSTIAASVKSVDLRHHRLVWTDLTMTHFTDRSRAATGCGTRTLCLCAQGCVTECVRAATYTSTRNARDTARCALSVDNQGTLQPMRQNRWLRTWWFQRWIHVMCCAATLPRLLTLRYSPTGWQTLTHKIKKKKKIKEG